MKRVPVVVQGNYGEAFRKSPLSGNCDEQFQVVPSTVLTYRLAHGAGPHVTRPVSTPANSRWYRGNAL